MRSPNRAYIPEVDQVRALAAVLVFFFHTFHAGYIATGGQTWPQTYAWLAIVYEGHTGVSLFMVLSGFILAYGALGRPLAYGQFLKNRALRILPLMVFVVVFAIYANKDMRLDQILTPFFLLMNTPSRLFPDDTNFSGTVWTISVEFQFYLIAPFIFAFVSREGLRFLLPAILFVVLCRIIVLYPHLGSPGDAFKMNYYTIIGRLNQFLIGVGLAYLWPRIELLARSRGALLALAGAVGIVALATFVNRSGGIPTWHWWQLGFHEVEAFAWAAFLAGYLAWKPQWPALVGRTLVFVGTISFSMYLLHWAVIKLCWDLYKRSGAGFLTQQWEILAACVPLLALVIAFSALSYYCVERPFLALRGRYVPLGAPSAREQRDAA